VLNSHFNFLLEILPGHPFPGVFVICTSYNVHYLYQISPLDFFFFDAGIALKRLQMQDLKSKCCAIFSQINRKNFDLIDKKVPQKSMKNEVSLQEMQADAVVAFTIKVQNLTSRY